MTAPCDPGRPQVAPPRDPVAMLALVEQTAQVGHWRVDAANWGVYWSPEVFRIHGRDLAMGPPDIGTAISAYHADDRPRVERLVNDAVELGAPFEFTLRIVRPNGEIRHVLTRGRCEFAPCGGVDALFGVIMDVTEQKRAEEAAEQARMLAEAASEAKTEFLASMSHEIRTPLNGILGFADLLLEQEGLDQEHRRLAERIQSAGAALRTIVDDILDFSEIESGKVSLEPQRFELATLVDDAVSIVSGLAGRKGLELKVKLDERAPRALIGDQDRLRQVLLNLLNNAVKFTPTGSVSLTVECAGASLSGETLRFSVVDTGIGIPEERRCRLFKRFSQLDGSVRREYGGSGLGLAISKTLVELMGGEIGVEDTPGGGATFWFEVLLPPAEPGVASVEAASEASSAKSARILLVEDLEINQELARAVLESSGHAVDVVGDGADAVMAVQARDYDLVLMDVHMPGMDGIAATEHIRALDHPAAFVPIVAMTANVLPAQVKRFREAGMDDHIGKPFKRAELCRVIDRWTETASLPEGPADVPLVEASVLDAARYAEVEGLVGPVAMTGFLNRLMADVALRLSDERLASPDLETLAKDAHAVVSSAGMLGYVRLSDACAALERAARDDRDDLARALSAARAERDAVIADGAMRLSPQRRALAS